MEAIKLSANDTDITLPQSEDENDLLGHVALMMYIY